MISKQEFIEIINRLKEVDSFVNETNEKARKLNDSIISDFFNASSLSISHENIVVKLLENMFNDKEILSWWLYELNYGRNFKLGNIQEDGEDVDLSTPANLYDYLIRERKEK